MTILQKVSNIYPSKWYTSKEKEEDLMQQEAPFESLTKLEAAERQLRVAIRLFFQRKDLVAVHTLAAAAQGILQDLGSHQGVKSIFKETERIQPEYREKVTTSFRQAQNFFKHADKNRQEKLRFYYEATKFYLFDAASLYLKLTNRPFPEALVLVGWILLKFPNLLIDEEDKKRVANAVSAGMNPDDLDSFLTVIDMLAAPPGGAPNP